MKNYLLITCFVYMFGVYAHSNGPKLMDQELEIKPRKWETCYQYAERQVTRMIKKHWPKRIIGSIWLSEFWAHHYYGAIEYRNYHWQAV